MTSSARLQPLFLGEHEFEVPAGWAKATFSASSVSIPVGKKWANKTVSASGSIPVIDQSPTGIIGFHDETPGVACSVEQPVFTFANHTCAMRWMTSPFSCIQNVFAFKGAEGVSTSYLFYASMGRVVLEEYKGHAPQFRSMWLPLPPLDEQHRIGAFLRRLDERVDLLRQTNATLESIAQVLFKSWFVDFAPVRAKAEGREPEGMDAATAALFPSELEDSELGPIPKGWTAGRLADVVELKYGKSLRAADRNNGEIPVYGSGGVTGFHDKPLIEGPTVIVGRKGTVGSIYWESLACFPIDTVFYVEPKRSLHFAYFALQRAGLDGLNTDAAVPGLNRNNAYRQPVVIPPPELIHAWDVFAGALRSRIDTIQVHAANLSQLRDALLPRLISGKLRLPEAEREIEAATA